MALAGDRAVNLLLRVAVVVYALLLVLAAWPWREVPLLGPVSGLAWDALGRVGVRPGMAIFLHSRGDAKLAAHCQRVEGRRADGHTEVLYAPPCPPRGVRLTVDSFEVAMQRIARATPAPRLLTGAADDASRLRHLEVRRYAAIGDYFCRSPHAGSGDYAEVTLREQRLSVSYARGQRAVSDVLVCRFACDGEPVPLPVCALRPADDPAAALVGPAAP